MSNEGVAILLALYSRLKPPPSEAERKELLEFFRRKEEKMVWVAVSKESGEVIVYGAENEEEARAAAEAMRLLGGPDYEIKEVKEEEDANEGLRGKIQAPTPRQGEAGHQEEE